MNKKKATRYRGTLQAVFRWTPATRREMGPDTFSCSTPRDSCAPFATVL